MKPLKGKQGFAMKIKKKRGITLLVAIIVLLAIIHSLWANKALMLSEYTVASPRLPAVFDGYRIAQVSDLHNETFGQRNKRLLTLLRKAKPDIIVITGDLLDSKDNKVNEAKAFVAAATDIATVYFVAGNHEAWSSAYPDLETALVEAGVTLLRNESLDLTKEDQSIRLSGIDDPDFRSRDSEAYAIDAALAEAGITVPPTDPDLYTILLSHRPEVFETYLSHQIDLVFSGHAHGGQFRLPFIGGLIAPDQGLFPEYDGGLYTENLTNMIVSRGLGNSIIPLRINNRPELVVVTLKASVSP